MTEAPIVDEIPETSHLPTTFDKLRAIPWSLGYDLANTFFVQLTFFGTVFVLFLNELGLDKSQIGFLLAISPFISVLSLFITPAVTRMGYRKTFLLSLFIRTLITAGLILVPFIQARFQPPLILRYVTLITVAFAASRMVAMTAFLPWQQEYLPAHMRGRYSAYSSIIVSLSGLVAVAVAGYLLDQPLGIWRYSLLFGIGVAFGIVSVTAASRFPGGHSSRTNPSFFRINKRVLTPLKDGRFLRYLLIFGLATLSTGPILSFLPIFMHDRVGLSPGNVVFLQTGSLVGSLLSSYFWGWSADRYGSKPISLTGLLLTLCLPILWFIMPRASGISFPVALGISFLQGIASTGWAIGSGRMLFVSIVPVESKTEYLAQYNAWSGFLSGFGSILGGRLLQSMGTLQNKVFNISFDAYGVLFALGFILALGAALLLLSLHIAAETGLGEFAGLFFHGNPLLAISSVIRFYYAKGETEAVSATEQLGQARSPLTVSELIELLNDPRFHVRFEAIVSITRHSSDDRLVKALTDVLEGPDPALGAISAWALGRIGNLAAMASLRKSFKTSKYRSVQAHAARALGSLGDRESAPFFMERIKSNVEDMGIKVACSSALGRLQITDATPYILDILLADRYPNSRKEMGLALAQILGMETKFIHINRQLQEDPGTVLAQEMETLRTASGKQLARNKEILSYLSDGRDRFAEGRLEAGFQSLYRVIDQINLKRLKPPCQQILQESALRTREFGLTRLEYPTLMLLVLEKC